jgi:hypothetical protein
MMNTMTKAGKRMRIDKRLVLVLDSANGVKGWYQIGFAIGA